MWNLLTGHHCDTNENTLFDILHDFHLLWGCFIRVPQMPPLLLGVPPWNEFKGYKTVVPNVPKSYCIPMETSLL